MNKFEGKEINLEFLKSNALLFKKCADRCHEIKLLPNERVEFLVVPEVVNLAFSIELYLKFLLLKNGSSFRSHELLKLFNTLDSTIKQEIISLTGYSNDEFKSLLHKYSDVFVEWRYIHEKEGSKNITTEFMRKLLYSGESIVNRPKGGRVHFYSTNR